MPLPSISTGKRHVSSGSRETYILPRLVIDLDAADNPFVKRFEDMTEEEQKISRPFPRRRPYNASNALDRTTDKHESANPHHARANEVTAPDVLSYALLGDSNASQREQLSNVFRAAGANPRDTIESKILALTSSLSREARMHDVQAGFHGAMAQTMIKCIESCSTRGTFERIIFNLSATDEGCKFLAMNGKSVIKGMRKASKTPALMDLRLLNNLRRNLESHGVQIGSDLCNAGIYFASKATVLPALKMYLDILSRNSYRANNYTGQAAELLLKAYAEIANNETLAPKLRKTQQDEILKLITGWQADLVTGKENCGVNTLASVLVHRDNTVSLTQESPPYSVYIRALGEIGLISTIWSEYEARGYLLTGDLNKEQQAIAAWRFAIAFLIAGDGERAAKVLETSTPVSQRENSSEGTEGSVALSCITSIISDHYRFHHLVATEELWQRIRLDIEKATTQNEILAVTKAFIVSGFNSSTAGKFPLARSLEWGESKGKKGLLIMSGDTPLYFKAV